jgi:hypothetical protein
MLPPDSQRREDALGISDLFFKHMHHFRDMGANVCGIVIAAL